MKRRNFLKVLGITSGSVVSAISLQGADKKLIPYLIPPENGFIPGIPGFASGTSSTPSGAYLVGENGPEIMSTPGAGITSNDDLRSLLSNKEMVSELAAIRDEIRRGNIQIIKYTKRTYEIEDQWDAEGMPPVRT